MAFQPIVDMQSGRPFAYEALVRGPNGEGAATILSRVTPENRYAFDQACRVKAIETAMAAGIIATGARLSINFLPNAVYSPMACIQLTLRTAERSGFPLDRLIFEFTENEHMASPDHVGSIIDTYRRIGFAVAIDDFGAGHAGLDLFARFTPDMVKLDMELVRDIDADPRRRAIVRAMVMLCAELDTILIAEGIETEGEAAALRALGVRYFQGYLLARAEFERLPEICLA
ncbi:EAL domain-containing protein [Sphingomonas crusticola]|uniref:EAL domain-containing protein n=1 Tax=Sphingomonas crusticola TaxID=1697973 RepID=UPI000E236D4B|nr:EAL domain-containing protein [Sphingomonas crusticola]